MCRRLPILTRFLAGPAKMLGGFGLVRRWLTILYHDSDLGLILLPATFTNHYRRGLDRGIDLGVVASVAGWATMVGVIIA